MARRLQRIGTPEENLQLQTAYAISGSQNRSAGRTLHATTTSNRRTSSLAVRSATCESRYTENRAPACIYSNFPASAGRCGLIGLLRRAISTPQRMRATTGLLANPTASVDGSELRLCRIAAGATMPQLDGGIHATNSLLSLSTERRCRLLICNSLFARDSHNRLAGDHFRSASSSRHDRSRHATILQPREIAASGLN